LTSPSSFSPGCFGRRLGPTAWRRAKAIRGRWRSGSASGRGRYYQPTTNDERLALSEWCLIQKRYRTAAGLSVQEVFAVTVLPGRRYPDLINDDEKLLESSFVVPTECLVAATVRASANADSAD
jgi:hypothetical protein